MSRQLVTTGADLPAAEYYNAQQMKILREQIAKDLDEGEFLYFIEVAKARGLNPILNQIYAIKRPTRSKDARGNWTTVWKMTIQTAIEGFLLIAERTGQLRGHKTWTTGDRKQGTLKGHAHVLREGREPLELELDFEEFAQTNKDGELVAMWAKMPKWMIQKVALARALDRAFPEQLGGLYTGDEMPPAEAIEHSPAPKLTSVQLAPEPKKKPQPKSKAGRSAPHFEPPSDPVLEPLHDPDPPKLDEDQSQEEPDSADPGYFKLNNKASKYAGLFLCEIDNADPDYLITLKRDPRFSHRFSETERLMIVEFLREKEARKRESYEPLSFDEDEIPEAYLEPTARDTKVLP